MVFVYHKEKPIAFFVNLPELNEHLPVRERQPQLAGQAQVPVAQVEGHIENDDRNCVRRGEGVAGQRREGVIIVHTSKWLMETGRYNDTVLTLDRRFQPEDVAGLRKPRATNYRTLATYRYLFDRSKPFERLRSIAKN